MTTTMLELETTVLGRMAVVQVAGEIDLSTAPRLRDALVALAEDGIYDIEIDLSRTTFIDSTAVAVLVAALRRCQHGGGRLALVNPSPIARKLLHTTRLSRLFGLPG
jgi:anti-sigma B factor antagonist